MAVMNKIPPTLAELGATNAASWVAEHNDWLGKVVEQHNLFIKEYEVDKYQAAYDGFLQSIDERDKSRGDDINHKLQTSLAPIIIDSVVDYMMGKPITWTVEADPKAEDAPKELVEAFRNDILQLLRSGDAQRVLAEQLRQGSIAYYSGVICWIDEAGDIDFEEFPVQEMVPVYDTRGKLRMVLRIFAVEADDGSGEITKVEMYDSKYVTYLVSQSAGGFELDEEEQETGNPVEHYAGRIPVSFFTNGTPAKYADRKKRLGTSDLATVFSLIEELAGTVSDKANTVDRLLDQFLVFTNVTTTEDEVVKMRKARAIVLKSKESSAQFLAPSQEDTAVENHMDRIEELTHQISGTPKINDLSGATATEIKMKYAPLDIKAGKKDLYFSQAIRSFILNLTDLLNAKRIKEKSESADVYGILTGEATSSVPLYRAEWLQFTIQRNLPQNFAEIAQIVAQLVGIVPDSYLYELLWFIDDPVAALAEMKKQKDSDSKRQANASMSAMGYGEEFGSTGADDQDDEEETAGGQGTE